ncbi:MAG: alpha/beta fold hydrolase [Gloeocapsa sp. UFS-A4-WI-NPMV-4B04]|jgi:2-succinyl-6-hydroxy-2,4-cyclohexadiene-1-carboxylate synthase|nr:alpha/beta fold hydrolase [Gloeocapsa sp. UFS-A4-WI-NPMV-4B04]
MKSRYYKSDLGSIHYFDSDLDVQETIVFLHGFTGSSRDFLETPNFIISNYRCLIPDLPGHGKTQVIETEINFHTANQVALLKKWLTSLKQSKFHLFGYSMGGRLALQFAVKNYHQLHSLILVSTTAGIDEVMRKARVKADNELAEKILNSNPGDFLTAWLAQPLFKEITDSQDITKEVIRRLPLQPSGLACSLKYFGSGVMPSVWHQLINIKTPTLVIAGSKDQKYLALASKLVALIENSRLKVLPTGHAPLIESPTLLWKQVAEFLNDLNPDD